MRATWHTEAPGPAIPGTVRHMGGSRGQQEGQAREDGGREREAGERREKASGQNPPYRPRWPRGRNAGHSRGCNTEAPFRSPVNPHHRHYN